MKTKLIDLLGLTNMANDIRDWVNAHFQRKVDGKGLSTNDYDNTAKAKVDAIPADPKYTDTVYDDTALAGRVSTIEGKESGWDAKQDTLVSGTNIKTVNGESLLGGGNIEIQGGGGSGEENVIETVKVNGEALTPDSEKAVDVEVPTKTSDLQNDSGFITKSVNDLTNYYLKSETYTQAEVNALIGAIQQFHYEIYATLPASGESNVLYLIGPTGSGSDRYEEYVYSNSAFTKIGDTSIDLSGYVTTSALNSALADYTTTANLTTMLAGKQDTISDLATIRSGATLGATAYQKPSTGIPASDLASGVIPTVPVQDVTVGGTSVVSNGTAVIQQEVFWATYGTTTAAEIDAAVAAGKLVMCNYSNHSYRLEDHRDNQPLYFSCFVSSQVRYYLNISRTTNVWSGGTITHENAAVNKVSTISGNETSTTKYPNTKAVADALGKWGVISQTQTWSGTGNQPKTYVMSDLVYGTIPQANIDLFESAGATFNTTTGYFELNGLTDISYEEMKDIYSKYDLVPTINTNNGGWAPISSAYKSKITARTTPNRYCTNSGYYIPTFSWNACIETIGFCRNDFSESSRTLKLYGGTIILYDAERLRVIYDIIDAGNSSGNTLFNYCISLETLYFKNIAKDVYFGTSSLLSLASIVYMVENAINTTAITITLHADALARCTADTTEYEYNSNTYTGIVALATAKNITLAS